MTKSVRRALLFTSLLTTASVVAAAGLGAAPPPPPPVQQGGVAVDFVVLNTAGQPVTDLKPTEVSVKVAGKQRTISSLEFKKAPAAGAAGAAAPAAALPPPFHVNAAGGGAGRNLLIVIDNESLRAGTERAVRESLDSVLSQYGPNDRVAFSVAPRDTVAMGYGSGVAAVRAAVQKFTGVRPANPSSQERQCRTRDTLQMLRAMMEGQAGTDGPTSVIFIASGLELPGTINAGGGDVRCEVQTEHYSGVANAAAMGRINLYVAQGDDSIASRDNGLENLAGVGGAGSVLRAIPNGLAKVTNEAAGYWVATLAPDASDRPGSVNKLEVKVSREGVATRARTDFAVSKAVAGMAGAKPGAKATPREMIAMTTPFGDLPLRVRPVVSRGAAGKLNVLTMTESSDPAAKIAALSVAIFPIGGKSAASAGHAEEKQLAGRPVLLTLAVDPGKYRVRVAATDANGRLGAVDFEVDADLAAAGPVKIGGMLLLAPRGESFAPQILYSDEAEIVPYVELYFDPMTVKLKGAAIDIAATPDGPSLSTGMPGGQGTNEPDKFVLNGKIPIAKLAPGDYVVRLIVQADGGPEGKVVSTFRKVAK